MLMFSPLVLLSSLFWLHHDVYWCRRFWWRENWIELSAFAVCWWKGSVATYRYGRSCLEWKEKNCNRIWCFNAGWMGSEKLIIVLRDENFWLGAMPFRRKSRDEAIGFFFVKMSWWSKPMDLNKFNEKGKGDIFGCKLGWSCSRFCSGKSFSCRGHFEQSPFSVRPSCLGMRIWLLFCVNILQDVENAFKINFGT